MANRPSSFPSKAKTFAANVAAPVSRVPSAPDLSRLAPESGQDWSAYWTLITGMAVILFVLYLAGNGQLSSWLNLFILPAAPAPQPTGANAATSTNLSAASIAASAAGAIGSNMATTAGAIVNPLGTAAMATPQGQQAASDITSAVSSAISRFGSFATQNALTQGFMNWLNPSVAPGGSGGGH